jgi:predicted nucleic acid-binding protein
MKSALEKYGKGDFEGGDIDRKEANKYFDSANQEVSAEAEKMSSLYGESRNFGIIYKVIEENTNGLLEDKKKRDAYAKIIKLIREDKVLKKQFKLYEAFRNAEDVEYPEIFVQDMVNLACTGLNKKKITESNDKLLKLISEANLNELVDIDDDEMDLYESIEYLITHKPTFGNMKDYSNAKGVVSEYIKRNCVKTEENTLTEEDYHKRLKEITEKYSNGITESEMELIKLVESTEDKEGLFETKRSEAVKSIKESIGDDSSDVIVQLNEMEYNPNTLLSDIAKFAEISQIMSE